MGNKYADKTVDFATCADKTGKRYNIELDNIKPIFTNGNNILKGALYFMIYTIPSLVFLNIIPKNNTPRNQNKVLIAGYITSYIAMLVITISVISIYNYTYLELFNYPIYNR